MKLLIAGSRSIRDVDISAYVPDETELIISGGAEGVAAIAEKYADEHGLPKRIFQPRYDLYGRAAPIRRNAEMVDLADVVLAIWDGVSSGTKHTISYAKKKNKELVVLSFDGAR